MQDSHSQGFIAVKPDIICTFPIHYGSLQKMLTALFNFIWNTQKSKCAISFECPGKMFLSIEKALKKMRKDQPYMHYLIVFFHIFETKVSHFY